MSLLYLDSSDRQKDLAQKIFHRQIQPGSKLTTEYSDYRQRVMLRDTLYHLEYLDVALRYQSEDVFLDFAFWILDLLNTRMQDIPFELIKEQMVTHYQTMIDVLAEEYAEEAFSEAEELLQKAITATQDAEELGRWTSRFGEGPYADIRKDYLQCLLDGDRRGASQVVTKAIELGVSLDDVYMEIFQETMREVGNRWHHNEITVDKEHYCTAITQSIMAEQYNRIFTTPRVGRTIVACCVGNELHEMGIRMVCDIFEVHGWDSIYLGSAVPTDAIVHALHEHRPDLLALSVTMFPYVSLCREVIETIRGDKEFDSVTIAVGGRALAVASNLPERWGVVSASNGTEFVKWANDTLGNHGVDLRHLP